MLGLHLIYNKANLNNELLSFTISLRHLGKAGWQYRDRYYQSLPTQPILKGPLW
jgi:hypothetical protein